MSWIIRIAAGLFEVGWAILLGETNEFRRPVPTVSFLVTLGVSMYLLSVTIRTIPIGTAYAVWVGIGAAGAFLVSVLWRGESTSLAQVGAMVALVASIVAVKLTSVH